jgi:hypothetical protein
MKDNYGIITEQGDLGLGFDPISENEAKVIKEHLDQKNEADQESINESK